MSLRMFIGEALANFPMVGAISPSSKYLANAMLDPLPLERTRIAVELGAGTGAITSALLDRLPLSATLLVFEINGRFFDCLRRTISDPRVILINSSVEYLDSELHRRGIQPVDVAVSSLGLAFMPDRQRHALFERLVPFLTSSSAFTRSPCIHPVHFPAVLLLRLAL